MVTFFPEQVLVSCRRTT